MFFEELIISFSVITNCSSVGTVTGYGLDGPRLIPHKDKIFLLFTAFRLSLAFHSASYLMGPGVVSLKGADKG
jgi:hypothetical protein